MRVRKELRRSTSPKKNWDSAEYMGFNPDSHDWARLAAFIDGEGSINLSPKKIKSGTPLYYGKVVVTNTDFRLAKWCLDTFGINFYSHSNNALPASRNQNWALCVYAQACSNKAAWILRNCLPYFILKRQQAEIVLEHQRTKHPDYFERGSGIKTPANVLDFQLSLKKRLAELNKRGRKSSETELTSKVMEA